jgi:hypothetical protein
LTTEAEGGASVPRHFMGGNPFRSLRPHPGDGGLAAVADPAFRSDAAALIPSIHCEMQKWYPLTVPLLPEKPQEREDAPRVNTAK